MESGSLEVPVGATFAAGSHLVLSLWRPGAPGGAPFSSLEVFPEGTNGLSESRVHCVEDCFPRVFKVANGWNIFFTLGELEMEEELPDFWKLPSFSTLLTRVPGTDSLTSFRASWTQ